MAAMCLKTGLSENREEAVIELWEGNKALGHILFDYWAPHQDCLGGHFVGPHVYRRAKPSAIMVSPTSFPPARRMPHMGITPPHLPRRRDPPAPADSRATE
jgi:hypothetical protein